MSGEIGSRIDVNAVNAGKGAHRQFWSGGWHLCESLKRDIKVDYDTSDEGAVRDVSIPPRRSSRKKGAP